MTNYVENAVADVLRTDAVAGIDFDLNGLHITGAGFERVARLVEQGHIRVQINRGMCSAGQYDPSPNILWLPTRYISDRTVQVTVVHEATHALCDLARARGYVYVEESAAYLADAIFDRLAPSQDERRWVPPERPETCSARENEMLDTINWHRSVAGRPLRSRRRSINARASERIKLAARALVDRYNLHEPVQNRRPLTWGQFAALRNAVASAGSYEFNQLPDEPGGPPSRYQNDGIVRRPNVYPARAIRAL